MTAPLDPAIVLPLYKQFGVTETVRRLRVRYSRVTECLRSAGIAPKRGVPLGTCQVSPLLVEDFDGLLLGDGCLHINRSSGCLHPKFSLRQEVTRRSWVEQVAALFDAAGIAYTLQDRMTDLSGLPRCRRTSSTHAVLQTRTYRELDPVYSRWYQATGKVVPPDVRLTPRALAHWYWGDGTLSLRNGGPKQVTFMTQGFAEADVCFLAGRLTALYGWRPTVGQKGGLPVLRLNRKAEIAQLLGLVRPFATSGVAYKVPEFGKPPSDRPWAY